MDVLFLALLILFFAQGVWDDNPFIARAIALAIVATLTLLLLHLLFPAMNRVSGRGRVPVNIYCDAGRRGP